MLKAKRRLTTFFVICLIFVVLSMHAPVHAALTDTNIGASINGNTDSQSIDGTNISATVRTSYLSFSNKKYTITLTNNSGKEAILSFIYSTEGGSGNTQIHTVKYYSTSTASAVTVSLSSGSPFRQTLQAGGRVEIYAEAGKGDTVSTKLTDISLKIKTTSNVIFASDSTVSYTVGYVDGDGATQSVSVNANGSDVTINAELAERFTITPTTSGYVSESAIGTSSGTVYIDADGRFTFDKNEIVTPIFLDASGSKNFKHLGNGKEYYTLNAATNGGSGTVVLQTNYTLPAGDYLIPKGVTLLVPFDDANTLCTTSPAIEVIDNDNGVDNYSKPEEYRTLTLLNGANITVNGALSVSGYQGTIQGYNGCPSLSVGFIRMDSGSSITINSGAYLYAWGYIVGSGSVTAKSNATIYECFQVRDWRGGNAVSNMNNNEYGVFPLSQYYMQNIEVPLTLEMGASEKGYMTVSYGGGGILPDNTAGAPVPFIGSDGLFRLSSGSLTKDYDETTDRMIFTINGDLSLSSLSISIKASIIGTVTMNSGKYVLPINSNISVICKPGSNLNITEDIGLLPGVVLDINQGANLQVTSKAKVYIYDQENWGGYTYMHNVKMMPLDYAPGLKAGVSRTEADLIDAKILVNGTLNASDGFIYTTEKGANICSDGTGTVTISAAADGVVYQAVQTGNEISSWPQIAVTSAKLKNEDGTYCFTGKSSVKPGTYEYKVGKWICETHTWNDGEVILAPDCVNAGKKQIACNVCGSSSTEIIPALGHTEVTDVAVAPTCTETGRTVGAHCSVCDTVTIAQQVVAATGHTEVTDAAKDPTCTETGLTEGKHCSVCSEITVSQTEIPALGHKEVEVTVEPTCTEPGIASGSKCSVCEEVLEKGDEIPALGHNEVIDVAVAATCTETGLTEGKHCSVCNQVTKAQEVVPATGHTEVIDVAVDPTCTENGLTQGSHCAICGATLVAQEVVPAAGHTEVEDQAVDATCTVSGKTAGSHCGVCGETILAQEEIEATGHSEETISAVAPTCTTPGFTEGRYCVTCGEVFATQEEIAAFGHSFGKWEITTPPTSRIQGVETRICATCNETESRTIIAIYGTSIRVGDSLDLYFYVRSDMLEGTAYYAQITRSYADDVSTKDVVDPYDKILDPIPFAQWEPYGDYYRFCYSGIAGKEMTDKVSVTLYHDDGVYASITSTETISDYALRTLKSSTATDELRAVLMDMVRYGANCQEYFKYNTGNKADSKVGFDEYSSYGDKTLQDWDINDNSGSFSASVVAENRLVYSFYLSDVKSNTVKVSYKNHYNQSKSFDVTPVYNSDKGLYCVDVPELAVADGHQVITCVYTDSKGTQTVTGSIEGYLKKIDGTSEDNDVFEKLMYFVDSAYAYFH